MPTVPRHRKPPPVALRPASKARQSRQELQRLIPWGPSHLDRERQHHDLETGPLDRLGCRNVLDEIALPSADRAKRIRATRAEPSPEVRDDREGGRPASISATGEIRAILENLARSPDLIALQDHIAIDEKYEFAVGLRQPEIQRVGLSRP